MCDPLTLVATGLNVAGALIKGAGNSRAARMQAEVARGNADLIGRQGVLKENTLRDQVGRVLGAQRLHFGKAGLDPSFGSPLMLAAFSAGQGEVDARLIRAETAADQAAQITQSAALTAEAAQHRLAGWFGAGTSLVLGAAQGWKTLPGPVAGAAQGDPARNPWGIY